MAKPFSAARAKCRSKWCTNVRLSSLSALTLHSQNPTALAEFYRDALGLLLTPHQHGTLAVHYEGSLGGVHFAIWKAAPAVGGPVVPVFRVISLEGELSRLSELGLSRRHDVIDIGEGKRVVTLSDPDGNAFRLIEIALQNENRPQIYS